MRALLFNILRILCVAAILALPAHGHASPALAAEDNGKPFQVLASTFPIWLFTANICAGLPDVRVDVLIPASAGCPHDFALKPADLKKLSGADALVINGAGLDDFLLKAVAGAAPHLAIIDAGRDIAALSSHEDDGHGHGSANPHIFAAPREAAAMSRNIAAGLERLNQANASAYAANAEKYAAMLNGLANKFALVGKNASNKGIALEHDALAYLAVNAGLEIKAIFEDNMSASRLMKLEKELKSSKPALIAGDAQYPGKILKTLSGETGIPHALLNPCANGPADAAPDYYQREMENNLLILEEYFGR